MTCSSHNTHDLVKDYQDQSPERHWKQARNSFELELKRERKPNGVIIKTDLLLHYGAAHMYACSFSEPGEALGSAWFCPDFKYNRHVEMLDHKLEAQNKRQEGKETV